MTPTMTTTLNAMISRPSRTATNDVSPNPATAESDVAAAEDRTFVAAVDVEVKLTHNIDVFVLGIVPPRSVSFAITSAGVE